MRSEGQFCSTLLSLLRYPLSIPNLVSLVLYNKDYLSINSISIPIDNITPKLVKYTKCNVKILTCFTTEKVENSARITPSKFIPSLYKTFIFGIWSKILDYIVFSMVE